MTFRAESQAPTSEAAVSHGARPGGPIHELGLILPWLERRVGRQWIAASVVVLVRCGEDAFFPLLTTDGGLDLGFATYRIVSVLPFLATWTALYYALGRRLLPIMTARWVLNGGIAVAVTSGLMV